MIFVDTGAWIALLNRSDQHHREAATVYRSLQQQRSQLLTTDYVLDETITRLRYDTTHALAVMFLERIELLVETGVLTLVEIDNRIFREAIVLFRQYDSAQLSFTDCTSFVVCRENDILEAFAFDQHFSMMGINLWR